MDTELHNIYYFRHHKETVFLFGDAFIRQYPVTCKIIVDDNCWNK